MVAAWLGMGVEIVQPVGQTVPATLRRALCRCLTWCFLVRGMLHVEDGEVIVERWAAV